MANETREIVTLVLRLLREDRGATEAVKKEFAQIQRAITELQKSGSLDLDKFFKGKETPKQLVKGFQDAKAHLERMRDALKATGSESSKDLNKLNRVIEVFGSITEASAEKALIAFKKVAVKQKEAADTSATANKKFVDSIPAVANEMKRLQAEFDKAKTALPKTLAPLENRLARQRRLTEDLTLVSQRLRNMLSTVGFSRDQVENLKGMQDQLFKLRDGIREQVSVTERSIKSVREQAEANKVAKAALGALSREFNRIEKSIKSVSEADLHSASTSKRLIDLYTDRQNKIRSLERALNDLVATESKLSTQVSPDVRKQYEERVKQARSLLDTEKASLALLRQQKDEYVKAENAINVQGSALERVRHRFDALQSQLQTAARLTAEEMAKIRPDPTLISKYATTVRSTFTDVTNEVLNVNKSLEALKTPGESSFKGIRHQAELTRGAAEQLLRDLEGLQKRSGDLITKTGADTTAARIRGSLSKTFKDLQKDQHSAFTNLRVHLKEAQESTQGWTLTAEQGVRKYLKELTKTRDKLEDLRRQASAVGDTATMGRAESTLRRLQSVIIGSQKRLEDLVNTGAEFRSKETITKSFSDARKTLDALGQQFHRHAEAFKRSDFLEGIRSLSREQLRTIRSDLANLQHQYQIAIRSIGRDLITASRMPGAERLAGGFKELNLNASQASSRLADFVSTIKLAEKETTQLSELGRRFGLNFAGSYKQMAESGSLIHRTVGGLFNFLARGHDQSIGKTHAHVAALRQLENELVRFRSGVAEWSLSLLALGTLVTAPFALIIKSFLEFSDVMGIVRAVSNATIDQFKELQSAAIEMGATTRFTAEQAAQGLRFLAMAGFTATQAVSALPTTLNLAQAAAIDLGTAADVVTNIMTTFEMQVEDLPRAADVLTRAFTTSNSTLSELGFAFKFVGALGKGLGADFNDLVGSLALLHNAGMKGCYDDQTEVMTCNGFKLFRDLTYEDEIMTLNPDTLEMEWQRPTAIVSYKINEPLAYLKSKYLDLAVTNNHRLFIETRAGLRKIVTAEEFKEGYFFRTGVWNGSGQDTFVLPGMMQDRSTWIKEIPPLIIPMELWVEFLGWYFSEGSIGDKGRGNYVVALTQKEGTPGVDAIRSVLDQLPFNYNRSDASFRIGSQQLYNELIQYGKGFANKRIPQYVKDLDTKYLRIFLEAFRQGDGDDQFNLYTSNSGLKDDLYEITLKAGYGVHVAQTHEAGDQKVINGRTITATQSGYVISVGTKHTRPFFSSAYIGNRKSKVLPVENSFEWRNYDGIVYCAEVPNHLMYVRRNGKGVFCGNTMAGTALRGALDSMFNPTKQEAEVMRQLGERIGIAGFQITDASDKFVGFTEIIRQLEEAGFTSGEALALFGQRAGPGMASLLRMGSRQLQDYRDQLDAAEGTTDRISKQMEETLRGRFLLAFSALSALGEQIAHNLEPVLGAIADSISTVVNKIIQLREALGPITKVFDIITASVAALIATLGALTFAWFLLLVPAAQFITFLHTITAVVASGTVAITKNTTATTANAVAQEGLTGAYFRQVLGIKAAKAATISLTAAQAASAAEAMKTGKMDIVGIFKPKPGDLLRIKKAGVETAADFNKAMKGQLSEMMPAFIGLGDRLKGIFTGAAVTVKEIAKRLVNDLRSTITQSVAVATGASQGVVSVAGAAAEAANVAAGAGIRGLFFKLASAIAVATKAAWGLVLALTAVGVTGLGAVGKLLGLLAGGKFVQAGLMLAHGFKVAFGVLRGLAAFLITHPLIAIAAALVTVFWLLPRPIAVTNAELEKTKGLLKSAGSEAESNINKIIKGQKAITDLVNDANKIGSAIPLEDIAKEQSKVIEGADRLVKLITEYGKGVANIKLDIGDTGTIEAISVVLRDGSAGAELYNANLHELNLTQQQLADRSVELNRVLIAVNGVLKERAFKIATQQAILLNNETAKLRAEFDRLSQSSSIWANNITTPFATQQERMARSIQIQNELNTKVIEHAKSLGLIGKSEEEARAIVERANQEFENQHGIISRLGDLVRSVLIRSWVDSEKAFRRMGEDSIKYAAKVAPELQKFRPEAAVARWQRAIFEFRDTINTTIDDLEKLQKESSSVLKDFFEFDRREAERYFDFIESKYQREVDTLESTSEKRIITLSNASNRARTLVVLEAEEAIRLENDKLVAAERLYKNKLNELEAFVKKQRDVLQAAGQDTFELDKYEYETKKTFLSDRLKLVNAALEVERKAHQKLADYIKKLDEDKKSSFERLAGIRESLADKGLSDEEIYAKKSAKLNELISQARILTLSGQHEKAKEFADKATELAEELASDTEATEKKRIASLVDSTRDLVNIYDVTYRGLENSAKDAQGGIENSTKALTEQFDILVTALKSLEDAMTKVAGTKAIEEGFAAANRETKTGLTLIEAYANKVKEVTGQVSRTRLVPVDLGGGFTGATEERTELGENVGLLERYVAEFEVLNRIKKEAAKTGIVTPEQHQQLVKAVSNINNLKGEVQGIAGIEFDLLGGLDWTEFYQKAESGMGYAADAINGQLDIITVNHQKMVDSLIAGSEESRREHAKLASGVAQTGDKVKKSIKEGAEISKQLEQARGLQVQAEQQAELARKSELSAQAGRLLNEVLMGLGHLDINLESILNADSEAIKKYGEQIFNMQTKLEALVNRLPEIQAMGLIDEASANKARRLLELLDEDWRQLIDNVGEGSNINEEAARVLKVSISDSLSVARNNVIDLNDAAKKLEDQGLKLGVEGIAELEPGLENMLNILNDIRAKVDLGELNVDIGAAAAGLKALEKDFTRIKSIMEEPIKPIVVNRGKTGGVVVNTRQEGGLINNLINTGAVQIQRFAEGARVFRRPTYSTVPGVGSGDKVPALLEPGEFIIRKSSVKRFGIDFLNMINQGVLRMSSAGGMIANAPDRLANLLASVTPTPYYQTAVAGYAGGGVVSSSSGSRDVVDINLNVGNTKAALTGERQEVRKLVNSLKVLGRG